MSKSHYLRCKSLHLLPKFASKTQRIQVGNGQYVSLLFIIPIVIDIQGHRFEILTLVSEIYENVYLVLGLKNISELEGIINSKESCFSFLNRSISHFPKEQVILKPREQWLIEIEAPFIEEISGLAMEKMLVKKTQNTMMLKLKFVWNLATLGVTNSSLDGGWLDPPSLCGLVKWVPALLASGGIMCIQNRLTVPRSSLMACMLPRELRWEEMAPHHKGMTQLILPELGVISWK